MAYVCGVNQSRPNRWIKTDDTNIMKGRITIDFKGQSTTDKDGFEPVIRVNLPKDESEDVRDKLLKTFIQLLGGESNWLKIQKLNNEDARSDYEITVVKPSEIQNEIEIMKTRI